MQRRSEIGLRRALGAARGHIRTQFLSEAVLLTLAGGRPASPSAQLPPASTPPPKAGPSSSPPSPGAAGLRPHCSLAPPLACGRPCALPASAPPRPSGPS